MDESTKRMWRDRHDGGVQMAWSVQSVRAAEKAMGNLLDNGTLMQRAASGLADVILAEIETMRGTHHRIPSVVVLVGPGNNGGDALYAASRLLDQGIPVTVVLMSDSWHGEGLAAARAAGAVVLEALNATDDAVGAAIRDADIVVDGVFGIGARPIGERPQEEPALSRWLAWDGAVAAIQPATRVIAVDVPSPSLPRADVTVTFGAPKTSLLLEPWRAGRVELVDIGLDLDATVRDAIRWSVATLADAWPIPGPADHKYTRGVVGMATGSDAFVGAAVLGTVAAVTAGAGMVRYVGPQRAGAAVSASAPEATHGVGRVQAWVVGSGIDGPSERNAASDRYESVMEALNDEVPVVIDAGALSWLDEIERPERCETVITPHAGELASAFALLGITDDGEEVTRRAIESDPVRWARRMAAETGYVVLLKGGTTVIAAPSERDADGERRDVPVIVENRAPNWLATAGTGDVLAGILGVTLAAGLPARSACALAVYVHGRAADLANPGGPVRALDVATHVGQAVAELTNEQIRRRDAMRRGCLPGE